MLPFWVTYIAIALRLLGGAGYIRSTLRGRTKPNPITWFIWGLTAAVAFFAQLQAGVGTQAWMTCALAVGPLIIFGISIKTSRNAAHFTAFNLWCGLLALVGIVLWQVTDNALLAIACCIVADICGSIPTVRKAYRHPHSEAPTPYLCSIVSMVLTLLTLHTYTVAAVAFPLYIMWINIVIYGAIWQGRLRHTRIVSQELQP